MSVIKTVCQVETDPEDKDLKKHTRTRSCVLLTVALQTHSIPHPTPPTPYSCQQDNMKEKYARSVHHRQPHQTFPYYYFSASTNPERKKTSLFFLIQTPLWAQAHRQKEEKEKLANGVVHSTFPSGHTEDRICYRWVVEAKERKSS